MPINKPSQPLIPPTDVEEVEEIATSVAEAAIAADDTHAPLVDNLVPAENLPSYVDDVLEFASLNEFPEEGEEGKIYVALDTNNTYRWSGSAYVQVGGSEIDLTPYALKTEVAAKQDTLVSGTNIKTINGESILGEGDIHGEDELAREALAMNGVNTYPIYLSTQGTPYYFGGEYSVNDLLPDIIIDLAINTQAGIHSVPLPPLFIIKNSKSNAFEIMTNNGDSHEITADDVEHEVELDDFQICYQTSSVSVPQEEGPDVREVNSITVYYNYPESVQFYQKIYNNSAIWLKYNTNYISQDPLELYNYLYFVRNGNSSIFAPKIPVRIKPEDTIIYILEECLVDFTSPATVGLIGANGSIWINWVEHKDTGLVVEIDWSQYNIGGSASTDTENHMLRIIATVENSSFNVTEFQCDDLKPVVWFDDEPATILLSLTITSDVNEWTSEAPITCYRMDNSGNTEEEGSSASSYISAAWEVQYNARTKTVSLFFRADGCNFIDHKGNIAFTLSGLEEVQYNLYARTPDVLMPIPAENGSFDPSTLPVFTIDPTAGGDRLFGDKMKLYEAGIYSGYGPMVPNVIFRFNDEDQFGILISKTEDSHQQTVFTVRLLDDQFNPLEATIVITDILLEEPEDYELDYVINTKQLWCDTETPFVWNITTNYITDGWLAFRTEEQPIIL